MPMVMGQTVRTEIFLPQDDSWTSYRPLQTSNWNTLDCLVQYGDR